jgi:N-Dimethylarginine dimethylaminohydrolase
LITNAFVRKISRSLGECELLHVRRQEFNIERAARQHAAYVRALEAAGLTVNVLPAEPELPDAAFVEDPVLVLDEIAVICRLASASRAPETESIEREVSRIRPIHRIVDPGALEGGDVLRAGKSLYVGLSSRTNQEGIRQLEGIVRRHGYRVMVVPVTGCLHLKTGVTSPAPGLLIANTDWVDLSSIHGFEILKVPNTEPWGANTLALDGRVLAAESCPHSADLLERKGLRVQRLEISELQKAEAGLTCLSVLYSNARA